MYYIKNAEKSGDILIVNNGNKTIVKRFYCECRSSLYGKM